MGKYRPLACRFSKSPPEPRLEMKNVRLDRQRGRALTAALFPLSAFHKKRDGVGAFVPFSLEPSPNETLQDFVLRSRKGSLFFGGEAPTFTLYVFLAGKVGSVAAGHPPRCLLYHARLNMVRSRLCASSRDVTTVGEVFGFDRILLNS